MVVRAHTVLLSCVGRQTFLVREFQAALKPYGRVIAADSDRLAPGCAVADESFVSPVIDDPEYRDWMLALCREQRVSLLITLLPEELAELEAIRSRLEAAGVSLVGMDPRRLQTCLDKTRLPELCDRELLKPVPTWMTRDLDSVPDDAFPLLAKERTGKGSRGMEVLPDRAAAEGFCTYLASTALQNSYVLQPRLDGVEYGLDVVNDLAGKHAATFVRKKIRMRNGETDAAETVADERLERVGWHLAGVLGHQGPVDVDIMRCDDGDYLLDVNPRFGGGYVFSHHAGANIPAALVAWHQGREHDSDWLSPEPGIVAARTSVLQSLQPHPSALVIITTGGQDVGMGHATRQIALAHLAQRTGHEVTIVTDAALVAEACRAAGIPCTVTTEVTDHQALEPILDSLMPDRVVVDVHENQFPALEWIASRWPTTLVVSRIGGPFVPYGSDAVFVGERLSEWLTEDMAVGHAGECRVHSGRAYMLFRDEFEHGPGPSAAERSRSVLICHGGSDPHRLTQRCLRALEHTTGTYDVEILAGPAFEDSGEIHELAVASKHACVVTQSATDVAERMRRASVALINGGNIRYELCLTGTPFVAVSFRQRQYECTEQVSVQGAGVNLGVAEEVSDTQIAATVDDLMGDVEARERMQRVMTELFDTGGTRRVLSIVLGSKVANHG